MKKFILALLILCFTIPVYSQVTPVHGITIDGIYPTSDIVTSIQMLPVKTTTRIVFDQIPATNYIDICNQLSGITYIMGEITDSYYMKNYTLEQHNSRVVEYVNALGSKVDIWEVANEINGEWLGPNQIEKMIFAYDYVNNLNKTTAITLYYNKMCYARPENEMFRWSIANIPSYIKQGVDYVWISYYEDDCNNYQPNWQQVFDSLHTIFPNSKIGIGECGTFDPAKKEAYMNRYYKMNITTPNYVGGYFWWLYRQDCVPYTKPLWTTLKNILNDTIIPPPPSACNDLQEPNNTRENAFSIFKNSSYNAGLNVVTDIDWFKFNTTRNNTNIRFTLNGFTKNAVIELYQNTNLVKTITGMGSQNLVFNSSYIGSYFVKIAPQAEPLNGCYNFNFTTSKKPIIVMDYYPETVSKVYSLDQNYPNPFNPTTMITYNIPAAGNVKLVVYDIYGREVKTLTNEFMEAGTHTAEFNASNLASGVYIYRIEAGTFRDVRKMMLIK